MALMSLGCMVPGTKRIECVEENCGAASVKLSPEEMEELEAAVPHHEVMAIAYRQHDITQEEGQEEPGCNQQALFALLLSFSNKPLCSLTVIFDVESRIQAIILPPSSRMWYWS